MQFRKRGIDPNPGRRLAELRRDRGLSQQQLADAIGLTTGAIKHLETARNVITTERLLQLAEALDCEPGDILAPVGSPMPLSPGRKLSKSPRGSAER